jgi:Putative prokaryotic signal transducing protein
MKLLFATNDPTRIAFAKSLLAGEGIAAFELDVHTSTLEGSSWAVPKRLMVADREHFLAMAVLRDCGLLDG